MTEEDIRTILITTIKEDAKLAEDEFVKAQTFEDLIDSLTLLEIVADIEEKFDLEIDDEQIPEIKSFDEVVKLVAQMLDAKQQNA